MSFLTGLGNFAGGAANTYFRNDLGEKWDERKRRDALAASTKEIMAEKPVDESVTADDLKRSDAYTQKIADDDNAFIKAWNEDQKKASPDEAQTYPLKAAGDDPESPPVASEAPLLTAADYRNGAAPSPRTRFSYNGITQDKPFEQSDIDASQSARIAKVMAGQGDIKGRWPCAPVRLT